MDESLMSSNPNNKQTKAMEPRITSSRFKTPITKNHKRWRHPLLSEQLHLKSKETIKKNHKSHTSKS